MKGLHTIIVFGIPVIGILAGGLIYRDARQRDRHEIAPLLAFIVAGLFLAGSIPGLVAFAIAEEQAIQGFPTSIRIVPGIVAVVVYAYFR